MLTIPKVIRMPVTMRSRMMLEVASELCAANEWEHKQAMVMMRAQGAEPWGVRFFSSDGPYSIDVVVNGEADIAICNPGGVLTMALRGRGPFKTPIPVRAITVIPQFDQLGFAVMESTGLKSLADVKRRQFPLRVSLRGQKNHSLQLVCEYVFNAYGMSLADIERWGGKLVYSDELPAGPNRIGAVERGECDALFDEALGMFANKAIDMGMRFLAVDEPQLKALEADGLPRVGITKKEFPNLREDVETVDFSGWPVFCLESTSDDLVRHFCEALEARKDRIPWYGEGPMRLDLCCSNTRAAPLTIPLHSAAEAFWREKGYI